MEGGCSISLKRMGRMRVAGSGVSGAGRGGWIRKGGCTGLSKNSMVLGRAWRRMGALWGWRTHKDCQEWEEATGSKFQGFETQQSNIKIGGLNLC